MKIQGHLRDYPLNDLLEILANRHESGCLRIEFEPEPALFYFNGGQLVDAQMSFLRGFAAVHLAFSRAQAPFDFDNQIAPPELAIVDENEELLMSSILRLRLNEQPKAEPPPDLAQPSEILAEQFSTADQTVATAEKTGAAPLYIAIVGADEATTTQTLDEVAETPELNATVFAKEIEPATVQDHNILPTIVSFETWAARQKALRKSWPSLPSYITKHNLIRAVVAVFVIAITATVGLTVLLVRKNSQEKVIAATREPTTIPDANQGVVTSQKVETVVPQAKPIETPPPTNTPAVAAPNTKLTVKPSVPETRKPKEDRSRQPQTADSPTPVEQPLRPADSTSKTIVVVVRVEQGHVAEAWVKDSRKGLEAYEATAIRLARQRRYPAGASRTESVPINVSINK